MTMTTTDKPLLDYAAEDLMSRDLILIPHRMSLRTAAHLLAQAHVSGAPVVDDAGRCVGVLSATDLVHWIDRDGRAGKRQGRASACVCSDWEVVGIQEVPEDEVWRHMTADVVTADPAERIGGLARRMIDAHIHRVVVVDGRGRPVGVVTSTDVLAAVAHGDARREFGE
jgi:CBS-domain-containing membrane protein